MVRDRRDVGILKLVMKAIFGITGIPSQTWHSRKRISLTCLSFAAVWGKRSVPGAIIGIACYQRHSIVDYSAYIFKALNVTPACGLCGMHPAPPPLPHPQNQNNNNKQDVYRYQMSTLIPVNGPQVCISCG